MTVFLRFINIKLKQTRFKKNATRQYNIQISDKIIFLKYRTKQIKATETNKLNVYLKCNGSLNTVIEIINISLKNTWDWDTVTY